MKGTYGSSGMAAGNSLEEALTQGCSELCEHYVEN
jgi:ribosomal protein S12 methylthiotransferase accessory factor YcaO